MSKKEIKSFRDELMIPLEKVRGIEPARNPAHNLARNAART